MAQATSLGVFSRLVGGLRRTSSSLFGRYLLGTNVTLSVGLSATGDFLEQHYEILTSTGGDDPAAQHRQKVYDARRTAHMSASGATVGVLCHYWYQWLDHRMPGRTLRVVVRKVVVDQLLLSPVAISLFFCTVGVLEGSSAGEIGREILEKGHRLYLAEWFVWPVAQVINFSVLPTRYRVLYDNTVSLGFDVYTSYVKHGSDTRAKNVPVDTLSTPLTSG